MNDEAIARELTDVPWCPLRTKDAVRFFAKFHVRTGDTQIGYALAVTDLVRVWVCGAADGAAVQKELTTHNPHLECTLVRAATLLDAAMRRNSPREALGSSGGVSFIDEETPISALDCPNLSDDYESSYQTVLTITMNKRLAGYSFRWCFVCHPFGLPQGCQLQATISQLYRSQLLQAEFVRAQLLEPSLRIAAIGGTALQIAVSSSGRSLEIPQQAEDYVADMGTEVIGVAPCTGTLLDVLYRRCMSGISLIPGRVLKNAVLGGFPVEPPLEIPQVLVSAPQVASSTPVQPIASSEPKSSGVSQDSCGHAPAQDSPQNPATKTAVDVSVVQQPVVIQPAQAPASTAVMDAETVAKTAELTREKRRRDEIEEKRLRHKSAKKPRTGFV